MPVPVLDPTRWWECPTCHTSTTTREPRPHTEMHHCRSLGGLATPLVDVTNTRTHTLQAGTARHHLVERGDYTNGDRGLRTDHQGRIIMAVRTERADGSNDVHVYAPTAVGTLNRREIAG